MDLVAEVGSVAPGIAARAGVLTGEAMVTLGATDQGLVAGDLVNTASRLQSVAPAGMVLVGESTFRAASRAIVFEPAGEQVLKGKSAPVAAWRPLRVVAERGGRNRAEGLEPGALDHRLPAVAGRAVDAECLAGGADVAQLAGRHRATSAGNRGEGQKSTTAPSLLPMAWNTTGMGNGDASYTVFVRLTVATSRGCSG